MTFAQSWEDDLWNKILHVVVWPLWKYHNKNAFQYYAYRPPACTLRGGGAICSDLVTRMLSSCISTLQVFCYIMTFWGRSKGLREPIIKRIPMAFLKRSRGSCTLPPDCIPVLLVNTFPLLSCFVRSWYFEKGQRNTWIKYDTLSLCTFWKGHEDHVHFHQSTASDSIQLLNIFPLLMCCFRL